MKKLILIALLFAGCKKQTTEPTPQPTPQQQTPTPVMKSVKVFLKGSAPQGKAEINWDYKGQPGTMTQYTFSNTQAMFTKAVYSSSIHITGYCVNYPGDSNQPIDYQISVDGDVKEVGTTSNLNIVFKVQ